MKRCPSAGLVVFLWLTVGAVGAHSQEATTLILEGAGEAGGFQLGTKIRAYPDVSEVGERTYSPAGGGIRLLTDDREISEIQVLGRSYVTQKLIRPGESTLGEVLATYGDPQRRCSVDGKFVARYDGFEFQTDYAVAGPLSGNDIDALLASRVEAVILRRSQDYKLVFELGVEHFDAQEWDRLGRAMERTLCDQSDENPPSRVRTYGMKFLDYTPHYFLGLAWLKLGRCEAALSQWDKSIKREAIEKLEDRRDQIRAGRLECVASSQGVSR